jgi:hypothetical protein
MVFDGSVTSAWKSQARRVFYAGAQSIPDILLAGLDQQHVAGHKLFVDYSGKRVPIADPLCMPRQRRVP